MSFFFSSKRVFKEQIERCHYNDDDSEDFSLNDPDCINTHEEYESGALILGGSWNSKTSGQEEKRLHEEREAEKLSNTESSFHRKQNESLNDVEPSLVPSKVEIAFIHFSKEITDSLLMENVSQSSISDFNCDTSHTGTYNPKTSFMFTDFQGNVMNDDYFDVTTKIDISSVHSKDHATCNFSESSQRAQTLQFHKDPGNSEVGCHRVMPLDSEEMKMPSNSRNKINTTWTTIPSFTSGIKSIFEFGSISIMSLISLAFRSLLFSISPKKLKTTTKLSTRLVHGFSLLVVILSSGSILWLSNAGTLVAHRIIHTLDLSTIISRIHAPSLLEEQGKEEKIAKVSKSLEIPEIKYEPNGSINLNRSNGYLGETKIPHEATFFQGVGIVSSQPTLATDAANGHLNILSPAMPCRKNTKSKWIPDIEAFANFNASKSFTVSIMLLFSFILVKKLKATMNFSSKVNTRYSNNFDSLSSACLQMECEKRGFRAPILRADKIRHLCHHDCVDDPYPRRTLLNYTNLTKVELQAALKNLGECTSGNKEDLQYRLLVARETMYRKIPHSVLKAIMKQQGIKSNGMDLSQRLAEAGPNLPLEAQRVIRKSKA
jgi:hypothetical protein